MKQADYYSVHLSSLLGLCLTRWRRILFCTLAVMAAVAGLVLACFRPVSPYSSEYHEIRTLIARRGELEEELSLARQNREDDLFRTMDPDDILCSRLSIFVELSDPSLVTYLSDPADVVLYSYFNAGRSQLLQEILVDEVLTTAQMEQFLELSYHTSQNLLTLTITCDAPELIDAVMAIAVQWFLEQAESISQQTYSHTLSILPLAEIHQDPLDRQALVDTSSQDAAIRDLESQIVQCNTQLDEWFHRHTDWALEHSQEELTSYLNDIIVENTHPNWLQFLFLGATLGLTVGILCSCLRPVAQNRLLGERDWGNLLDWDALGRLTPIPTPTDPVTASGYRLLFADPYQAQQSLVEDTIEVIHLMMDAQNLEPSTVIGILGVLPEQELDQVANTLCAMGLSAQAASLSRHPVTAHRLIQEAGTIIIAAQTFGTCVDDLRILDRFLAKRDVTPLGYVLV